jgi:transcriptional regulator with XRE-family HTH domain
VPHTDRDLYIKQFEAGEYLKDLRTERALTLDQLSNKLGISKTYLHEIERGKKVPADALMREIATFFDINEPDLFQRFGKIPLHVTELLEAVPEFQTFLANIEKNKNLTKEDKLDFVGEIEHVYNKYLKGRK